VGEAARVAGVAAEVAGMGTEDVRARLAQPNSVSVLPWPFAQLVAGDWLLNEERISLGELPIGGSA
jgi:hypothetical protein